MFCVVDRGRFDRLLDGGQVVLDRLLAFSTNQTSEFVARDDRVEALVDVLHVGFGRIFANDADAAQRVDGSLVTFVEVDRHFEVTIL